ncbi:uncharacterized protein LOC120573105 isoform X4 [Perca fluviatilis]|uniref:uncharacterized protein LOC120573105 isoform X4 n=1 Tax=Perca fluviatilis TaxID=8168 RepID=UPI001964D30E|nr:uncharacterized protein LOC120573105 isoform X4 [Perca fluviatilis]
MNREKMICSILLLIILTTCVSGTLVVNVTQTSYQAEENHHITLEWTFTTNPHTSSNSLYIYCVLLTDLRPSVLFYLHEGVEAPEFQHEKFAGRVQWDKDVLREGRLRLHVSRLRTEDSGLYECKVHTSNERSSGKCWLHVTAARDRPEPETPNTTSPPQPRSWGSIGFYCGLTSAAAAAALLGFCFCVFRQRGIGLNLRHQTQQVGEEILLQEQVHHDQIVGEGSVSTVD